MLPIHTVQGVKDGISTGMIIDLSEYLKKVDGVSKDEFESLEITVGGKLDREPMHKHHIEDIRQLQNSLDSKYDKGEKYSYNVILSDSEKIPYLEAPKIKQFEIVQDQNSEDGYQFYVDDASGDLMIVLNDILIGTYTKSTNSWSFGGINMNMLVDGQLLLSQLSTRQQEINQLHNEYQEYVAKTDAILKNHYDALIMLLQQHDMVDTNPSDGSNVSPA